MNYYQIETMYGLEDPNGNCEKLEILKREREIRKIGTKRHEMD